MSNAKTTIENQVTLTSAQWAEIEKLALINKIKNQIADLLEKAPELNITETFDFIFSLTERELRKRLREKSLPVS